MTLTDGRGELYQWDTGRTLTVDDATITQVHFQNRAYGRTIDVDVKDGSAIIPDEILQKPGDLRVYAFSGTAASGFTKVERVYNIIRRNKPNDYMYTPTEQKSLDGLQKQIGNLEDLTTAAKNNLVAAINETATAGQTPGLTGVAVGQIPVVKAVDSSGKPTEWEAIDIPQSDWEQTDESAADYVKNRPFGSFAHHTIDFSVSQGNTKFEGDPPGFDTLSGVVGEKPAHIEANGYIYCQGKAVTVLDDENGDITITFTSDDNLNELVFSGRYGNLTRLTINKSNITWEPWNTYSLFIDGLTYTIYKKLSSYSVEGTLPETNRNDHILVSSVDGSWNVTPVENINPIFQLSGASAGQIAKIAAVDTSGKPTSWEAVDMPSGGEREWIKIGEVTTAEDAAGPFYMKFTKDINGNSLSLKGVLVIGTPLFSDTKAHNCALKCNDSPYGSQANFFLYRSILRNGQTFTIYSEFLRGDGLNSVVVTVSNQGNVKQLGGAESYINTWSPTKETSLQFPMRGINFEVIDSGLLAGSKFEFWGIKA